MIMYDPWADAEDRSIRVKEISLFKARGYSRIKERLVILNRNQTYRQKKEALAHELCHFDYSVGIAGPLYSYAELVYQSAHEKFIDRKAAERCMPEKDLYQFLKSNPCVRISDIAERFDITERYVDIRLEDLFSKGNKKWEQFFLSMATKEQYL